MTLKEVNYTAAVVIVFGLAALTLLFFFTREPLYIAGNYLMATFFFLFILAFPYFLLKFFFYVNSRNKNDELHLNELPKDQEDIEHSH